MTAYRNDEERRGKGYDWRLMRRLLPYLRPHKWTVAASLALAALTAPLLLAGPPFTRAAIDLFIAPDAAIQPEGFEFRLKQCAEFVGLGSTRRQGLIFVALALLLATLMGFAIQYVQLVLMDTIGQRIMLRLREELFAHVQRLPVQFYDRTPVGHLMTRISSDVDALNELFTSGVIDFVGEAIMALYIVVWMFQVNRRLTLVSFAILPPLAVLVIWFRARARSAFRSIRAGLAAINAFLQEHLTGMQIVQLFGREAVEGQAFDVVNGVHWKAQDKANYYYAVFYPLVELSAAAGIASVIWYGGGQVLGGIATIGTLIAFIQMARAFYDPISDISEKYNILEAAMASSERIFMLLDEPIAIEPPRRRLPPAGVRGRIEFRHVWFAYEGEDWVLRDISFLIEPGEKVAFVGHTGAGKTTITNLLLRFYEIQRGEILLDDVDIREVDPSELRSNFSVVLQETFLFSGDIASNIGLGNTSITRDRMESAARAVHADHFITRLPSGYESGLSERGAGLSAGQKQLIGLARALAFDRPILMLDEATSSIDTHNETLIRDAVKRVMRGRTSLVIAHRLSTIKSVDKIIVIHKGTIREVGNHRSLLACRGLYWKLYQLQFTSGAEGIGA